LKVDVYGAASSDVAPIATQAVEKSLTGLGIYEVIDQVGIERIMASIKKPMPASCRDPRCVIETGAACNLDRMIFGYLEKGAQSNGISLMLIDVASRLTIESVNIQSPPGVEMTDLIETAVAKLHGQVNPNDRAAYSTYWGPEVHNEKEMLIAAGATVGAGVVWSLLNGSLYGRDKNTGEYVFDYTLMREDMKHLAGIPTGADNVSYCGRPAGLANSYVAASEDAYGVFYNPAGLAWANRTDVAAAYQYRYGLNNFMASYAGKAQRDIGFGNGFLYSGDSLMSEVYFISSVSYKLNNLARFMKPISVGLSLKMVSWSLGPKTSESSVTGSSFGLAWDLGIRWQLAENIHYGAVLRNLPLYMSHHNTATDTSYSEFQPSTLLMGGTFQAGYTTFLICEAQIPMYKDQPWEMAGGIEQEMFRILKTRIGLRKEILASATASTPWIATGGVGITINRVTADGAYEFNQFGPFSNVVNFSFRVSL
jgi:hypothetical protein